MENKISTQKSDLEQLRHSTSHVMAQAVQDLFPGTKLAIGPAIEDGFYYDFARPDGKTFTPEDLTAIENRMHEIVTQDLPFFRKEVSKEDAISFFTQKNEKYKLELISELGDQPISLYQHGTFTDLCRGPHVISTNEIKFFKLLSVAGAYWRGDETRDQLQRIYGTAFFTATELESHLKRLEEAKRRDHRVLGKQLDLFSLFDESGPGLVFWHPKGALVRKSIEDFWRTQHLNNGYQLVYTPHIAKQDLWHTSGHLDFYRENMFSPMDIEGQGYLVKPMNCPFHILIYQSQLHSYRDLPIRFAELGTVYRYERSGVLHGLMRVRGFTQDDAHIFCRKDQLATELVSVLSLVLNTLKTFGFTDYVVNLSTRPEKYVGTIESWEHAESALKQALSALNLPFEIDPGAGVFYGPKIDIQIKDCLNRTWQCSTIQVDFNLSHRFKVTYRNQTGGDEEVIMIHRALMGSLERFFGVLIEHYAGDFPLWLAPVQVRVLPITDKQNIYAQDIVAKLVAAGIRTEPDLRNEKVGSKIRDAELLKIPFMLIIGQKETDAGTVSVRKRGERKDLGQQDINQVISLLREMIESKTTVL